MPPFHGLLSPVSSKGSFICTMPPTQDTTNCHITNLTTSLFKLLIQRLGLHRRWRRKNKKTKNTKQPAQKNTNKQKQTNKMTKMEQKNPHNSKQKIRHTTVKKRKKKRKKKKKKKKKIKYWIAVAEY